MNSDMRDVNKEARLLEIKKSMAVINVLNTIPNIALGLALYGLFVAQGDAFIDFLNSKQNCYLLIGISLVVEAFSMSHFIKLVRERSALSRLK